TESTVSPQVTSKELPIMNPRVLFNSTSRVSPWQLTRNLVLASFVSLVGVQSASAQLPTAYQNLIQSTPSLQNYWTFEDLGNTNNFTTVVDVKGGKTATAVGTVQSEVGLVGYAGSFPGDSTAGASNNVLRLVGSAADATLALASGSFTVEALVRTNSLPTT